MIKQFFAVLILGMYYISSFCAISIVDHKLLHAVQAGTKSDVSQKLTHGADINSKDHDGWTPLHHAAKEDQSKIASSFLKNDTHPNVKDNDGLTPLHLAAGSGHTEIVSLLLKHSANPTIKNNEGQTPLQVVRRYGYNSQEVIRILETHQK